MPRVAPALVLLALITACDGATDHTTGPSATPPSFASVGHAVDPAALTPAPPPELQPECRAAGRWIICHTTVVTLLAHEPTFDLSCGTLYETSRDARFGIRWYDASDSVIVKRNVRQELSGEWSLSPDGSTPAVQFHSRANWQDSQYTDPTDLESGVRDFEGNIILKAPGTGGRVIAKIAGHDEPDGTHHGVMRSFEDPAVVARVCAVLTG